MLIVLSFTAVALDALASNEGIKNWFVDADQRVNRINKNRYSHQRYFIDFEDRLVNEELPEADYSDGGVYLVGTSNLKWATRFWELPERQRSLIRNYGMGSFNHAFQFQFIRYLVEHEGFLKAGGDKTLVIFGVTYHVAGTVYDPQGFFANLWGRHGLYEYDKEAGITPRPAGEIWKRIHFKRVRIAGCLRNIASTFAKLWLGYNLSERRHDHDRYNTERSDWMGPDWKEKIRRQVAEFDAMASYLLDRGVKIEVVFLPIGTWEERLPFERAYIDAMSEVCRRQSIQTRDWSRILDDEDFADSNHPNPYGVDKLDPAFREIAVRFLKSTGALSE